MPIQFPPVQEVPLATPPLDEVVCQVRFPPILKIAKEEPVEFQELIRGRFPKLEKRHSIQLKLAQPGNPGESEAEVQPISYLFADANGQTQVVISSSFYAVTTKKYIGWQSFLSDLSMVHSALLEIYQPAYATRIGLRYINRLTFDNTGTSSRRGLFSLIRKELTSTLRGKVWSDAEAMLGILNFVELPAQLNIRYGFETDESSPSFLLDFDYFEEGQVDLAEVPIRCEHYHQVIYHAFRWMIKHEALERFGDKTV